MVGGGCDSPPPALSRLNVVSNLIGKKIVLNKKGRLTDRGCPFKIWMQSAVPGFGAVYLVSFMLPSSITQIIVDKRKQTRKTNLQNHDCLHQETCWTESVDRPCISIGLEAGSN